VRETENNQCPGKDKLKRKCLSFRRAPNSRLLSIITKRLDQGGTWYGRRPRRMPHCARPRWAPRHGGGPRSRPHCAMWGSSSPLPKKDKASPIFDPFLLWPNGWKHQDAIWYEVRPRRMVYCARWANSSPPKGSQPINFRLMSIVANGGMDQNVTCYGGRAQATLLDGAPAPPPLTGRSPPIFGPCQLWQNGWMD